MWSRRLLSIWLLASCVSVWASDLVTGQPPQVPVEISPPRELSPSERWENLNAAIATLLSEAEASEMDSEQLLEKLKALQTEVSALQHSLGQSNEALENFKLSMSRERLETDVVLRDRQIELWAWRVAAVAAVVGMVLK